MGTSTASSSTRTDKPRPPIVVEGGMFYHGDCRTEADRLINGSVDLIVTDPPYGIRGDKLHQHYYRDESHVVEGYVEVPKDQYETFTKAWIAQAERALRPGGSLFVVSGYSNLHHILNALHDSKMREVNHIIWKYNFGVYTSRKFVSSHYHILYWEKPGGRRKFHLEARHPAMQRDEEGGAPNYRDREDVWIIPREYKPGKKKNKNELPTALLKKILQYSSDPGDLVCDFFLGGFSTAKVALMMGRRAVGFEVSPTIFEASRKDMQAIRFGSMLPDVQPPKSSQPPNRGKEWADAELRRLARKYEALQGAGRTKKDTVDALAQEFGRGRWSIVRALRDAEISVA